MARNERQQAVVDSAEVRELVAAGYGNWRDLVAAAVTAYERRFGVSQVAKRRGARPRAGRTGRAARREARLSGREARPLRRAGEVYVTGGSAVHTEWCSTVNGVWLSGADTLRVVPAPRVGGRRQCENCLALVVGDA